MANKVAALLVMCLVLVAAGNLPTVKAGGEKFTTSCFNDCHTKCVAGGNGSTFCEMKCDTDCVNQQIHEKLKNIHIKLP